MDRIKDLVNIQEQIQTLEQWQGDRDDIIKECSCAAGAMQDFYEKMIFIAGLHVDVWIKVMEATPKFAYDALKVAMATETLGQKG